MIYIKDQKYFFNNYEYSIYLKIKEDRYPYILVDRTKLHESNPMFKKKKISFLGKISLVLFVMKRWLMRLKS